MRHDAIVLKFLSGIRVEQDHCHALDEAEFNGHLVDETTLIADQVAPAIVVHIVGVNVEAQHRDSPNDEVERPRDHLWRAADIVDADKSGIVRLALYASRTAPTDC
jgi:hypothetical protein